MPLFLEITQHDVLELFKARGLTQKTERKISLESLSAFKIPLR